MMPVFSWTCFLATNCFVQKVALGIYVVSSKFGHEVVFTFLMTKLRGAVIFGDTEVMM